MIAEGVFLFFILSLDGTIMKEREKNEWADIEMVILTMAKSLVLSLTWLHVVFANKIYFLYFQFFLYVQRILEGKKMFTGDH